MKYKKVLIIGSSSYAGRVLNAKLKVLGYVTFAISRSMPISKIFEIDFGGNEKNRSNYFLQADINLNRNEIFEAVLTFGPEVVVDFAGQGMVAESWNAPEQWYQTNILSKVSIHEFLRKSASIKQYIRVSTPEVYGSSSELITESHLYNPSTPYAVSHAAVDLSLKVFYEQYGFPVIFTRFANFYGPGQQLYRIIPRAIIYSMLGKQLELDGGGSSIRAFIHGNDVADALISTMNEGVAGQIYHFSPENFFTIKEVVEKICNKTNVNFENFVKIVSDRPGKDKSYLMGSTKARESLNWSDKVSLDDGIQSVINWVKSSIGEIKNLPLYYVHRS